MNGTPGMNGAPGPQGSPGILPEVLYRRVEGCRICPYGPKGETGMPGKDGEEVSFVNDLKLVVRTLHCISSQQRKFMAKNLSSFSSISYKTFSRELLDILEKTAGMESRVQQALRASLANPAKAEKVDETVNYRVNRLFHYSEQYYEDLST